MPPEASPNQAMQSAVVPSGASQIPATPTPMTPSESPDKDYVAAVLLSYFLGGFGIDRFYLGRIGTGVLKFVTLGGVGIWALIDFLRIVFGSLKDKQGLPLRGYQQYGKIVKVIFTVLLMLPVGLTTLVIILIVAASTPSLMSHASDTSREYDVTIIAAQLNQYQIAHQSYPTATQYSDGTFTAPKLEGAKLSDVTYSPKPDGCNATSIPCTGFTLITKLSDGKDFSLNN